MTGPDTSDVAARPWVILGCGYTGTRLATLLASAGARVIGTRRSVGHGAGDVACEGLALLDPGIEMRAADSMRVDTLDGWIPADAIIVDSAPPSPDGGTVGEQNLVGAAARAGAHRVVYLSATGVYPRGDGGWITEETPSAPPAARGQRRLACETAVLEHAERAGLSAVSLRLAGIHGPGRGVIARMRAGSYRIVGAGDTHVSRIHVEDVCASIIAAGLAPQLESRIYNVADNDPISSRQFADRVSAVLGLPRAPSTPADEVDATVVAMLSANRRISNARLKQELGVDLVFPSWRAVLDAAAASSS